MRNTSSFSGFKADSTHITSLLQSKKWSFISFGTTSITLWNNHSNSAFSSVSRCPCISHTKSVNWVLAAPFLFEWLLLLAHCEEQIFHNVKYRLHFPNMFHTLCGHYPLNQMMQSLHCTTILFQNFSYIFSNHTAHDGCHFILNFGTNILGTRQYRTSRSTLQVLQVC